MAEMVHLTAYLAHLQIIQAEAAAAVMVVEAALAGKEAEGMGGIKE